MDLICGTEQTIKEEALDVDDAESRTEGDASVDPHNEIWIKVETSSNDPMGSSPVLDEMLVASECVFSEEPLESVKPEGGAIAKLYKCEACDYSTENALDLTSHKKIHVVRHHACPVCNFKCLQPTRLRYHMETHTKTQIETKGYKCGYHSTNSRNLKKHVMTHTDEKSFSCEYCPYSSKRRRDLKRHIRTHTGEKPYKCTFCDYASGDSGKLKAHLAKYHIGRNSSPDEMLVAPKLVYSEEPLLSAKLEEGAIAEYKCDECGFSTTNSRNLKSHSMIHTDENPFSCEYCPYSSKRQRDLKRHIRTHTGEKPYQCTFCDYASGDSSKLKAHLAKYHIGRNSLQEEPLVIAKLEGASAEHKCDECGFSTTHSRYLKRHLVTHTDEKPFSCEYCSYRCKRRPDLKRHTMRNHTGENPHQGTFCDYESGDSSKFKVHLAESGINSSPDEMLVAPECIYSQQLLVCAKPEGGAVAKHKCDECGFSAKNLRNFRRHLEIHTDENPFSCEYCPYSSKWRRDLKRHMRGHTGEKPYKCNFCGFATVDSCKLKVHLAKYHPEPNPSMDGMLVEVPECVNNDVFIVGSDFPEVGKIKLHKCDVCDYATKHGPDMKRHKKTHEKEPYACTVCDFKCSHPRRLEVHMRTHYKVEHKCVVCGFSTTDQHCFKRHELIHTDEKPFSCKFCDYSSKRPQDLKRHVRSHTGEKPYKCTFCDYASGDSGKLKVHLRRIHTGVKPFICKVCGNGYAKSSDLTVHMRRHTGEKPFSCTICGHKCVQSYDLKEHMKIHTGEKPYRCKICDYKCGYASHFKVHMRSHAGEKPYTCTLCDYASSSNSGLVKHRKAHHSD